MDEVVLKLIEEYDAIGKTGTKITGSGISETYRILQENGLLPQLAVKAQKSDEDSEKLRAAGNSAYKTKDFKLALSCYTRAICCASLEGEPIALAYANRSAVHYECQAYDDVIKDIKHAMDTGKYPEDMKCKLLERRAKSYLALSQYQAALEDIRKVLSYILNGKLCCGRVNETVNGRVQENAASDCVNVTKDIDEILSQVNSDPDHGQIISLLTNGKSDREKVLRLQPLLELVSKCSGKPNLPRAKPAEPKLSHKPSKTSKNSSFPALEIALSPEMGKHVVAATSISPGDILAVERPYVSVLMLEFRHYFCDYCKAHCQASIPCASCTEVVFCSENCRQQSWIAHHSVECDLLPTLIALGCQVNVLIGIRGLLKATRCGKDLQRFVDEHEDDISHRKSQGRNPKTNKRPNVSRSGGYHSVHNLVTHEKDRSEVQSVSVMATVACVVHVMKGATQFFGGSFSQTLPLEVNHIVAANLVARYFMMAGCNAFEIRETNVSSRGVKEEPEIIGGALYPILCLLNHSCDPDVTAYMFTEETRVLYAVKPVRKGDQIFISYGPEYVHHDLATRQKALRSKYFFTCTCTACVKNWPRADNLPEYPIFISHRVESTQGPRIFDACKKLPEIVLAADRGQISREQMQAAAQYLSLYHKYVNRPWKYYFAAQRVIRQYFNNRIPNSENPDAQM